MLKEYDRFWGEATRYTQSPALVENIVESVLCLVREPNRNSRCTQFESNQSHSNLL
jgi:hypothetical protein